ncbi:MAG: hypothetical protein AAGK74_02200 [Chloroflexota bacterium]
MTWTTPKTWGTGDLVTASDMNTHLRDNLSYLKDAITFDVVSVDSNYTDNDINSFVDVDSTNVSLTVSTRGKLALVGFELATYQTNTTQGISFDITLDGTRLGTTNRGLVYHQVTDSDSHTTPVAARGMHWLTNLAAGSHTFKIVWRQIAAGTVNGYIAGTASGGLPVRLWLMEFDI